MTAIPYTPAPWTAAAWLPQVTAWADAQLAPHGQRITDALEPARMSPWSALWRVPTSGGVLWLKACAPTMRHEVAVLSLLSRVRPDVVPPIWAVEPGQGLILMGDGGELLRPRTRGAREVEHWTHIFPRYARLQQELAPYAGELLAAGVIDRRPAALPALYDALLADEAALAIGAAHGLTPAEHADLRALSPTFAARCVQVDALGIPATVDHSDFHDANILLDGGEYRFIDWGDACVAHPFLTLPVALRSIAYGLGLEAGDPFLAELRDLYLAQWLDYGTLDELRDVLSIAERLTTVNRALTWRRALATVPPGEEGEDADAVPGWLQEYLAAERASGAG
ncbi:MAG: phosphotransferase [Caldilineaceae bacterium]|nr:phosphotransferase [Caldilineaceae bacterium]